MSEKKDGVVMIHGRAYETVALRVKKFRDKHSNYSLTTEILHRDDECAVMKATISDESGRVISTGHSEEYRHTSQINRTSALENAETSAIGRALAALGLGGTEFASADEVANAISQQRITPVAGSLAALDPKEQAKARETAAEIVDLWTNGNEVGAYEAFYEADFSNEMKLGIWEVLQPNSKIRNGIKKINEQNKQKAA